MLMEQVAQYGGETKNWKDIARVFFPGKSALQVKNCWHNAKKPKKNKGRATRRASSLPPPPALASPALFLVPPESAAAPSTLTRSRSRAIAQFTNGPAMAISSHSSPLLVQLPVGNTKSRQSSSNAPLLTRVEPVASAVSLNSTSATTSTGGSSQKPSMAVSSSRKRSHSFVRWSMREDTILKQAIEVEGPTWEVIATKYFGNTRTDEQCKNRWTKV